MTTIIPPLLVNDGLISNFVENANIFNGYFSKQCQPMPNDSNLPRTFQSETANQLSTVTIKPKKNSNSFSTLHQNKLMDRMEFLLEWLKYANCQ